MLKILILPFIWFLMSCSIFQTTTQENRVLEFTSLRDCSGRGGASINYKSIQKDITKLVKRKGKTGMDTITYKTDPNKWQKLNLLIDFDELTKEMQSVGGNHHKFDGCNNKFTIKTEHKTYTKNNSKITSDKLKEFYELYNEM